MKARTSRARPRQKINPTGDKFPKHLDRDRAPETPDPTPEEIEQRCAEVRLEWSLNVHVTRWVGRLSDLPGVLLAQGFDGAEIARAIESSSGEYATRERRRAI